MALSGTFKSSIYSGAGTNFPDHVYVTWSATQNTTNNTSTISWKCYGGSSYSNTDYYVMTGPVVVKINGSTVLNLTNRFQMKKDKLLGSGSLTVSHNSDGTKSVSASISAAIYTYAESSTYSGTITLNTIPRASTITSAGNVTLGSKCNIKFTPASTAFYYTIKFSLGNWSYTTGMFRPGQTTAYTYSGYTIPKTDSTLLNALASNTTGTMTATLTTYSSSSSSSKIGSASSKTFTVTVSSDVKPTVGTITLTPQTYNYLIQGRNKLQISVSGSSAGSGSSIKSYTFSGPGIQYTGTSSSYTSPSNISMTGTSNQTLTYTVTVTDTRGRTASATKTITCYAYSPPSFSSFTAYRCDSSGTQASNGTNVKYSLKVNYSPISGNKFTVSVFYKKGSGSWTSAANALTDSTTQSASAIVKNSNDTAITFSTDSVYSVYAKVTDSYGGASSSPNVTLFGAERIFNIRKSGNGMAFGKMADSDNVLDSRWPIRTDDAPTTMKNLTYKGQNLLFTTDDTTDSWSKMGNLATVYYNQDDKLNGQPSQYGYLLNLTIGPGSTQVHHIWAEQANGSLFHRGGNANGLYEWKEILDTKNSSGVMPIQLYSTASGNSGTITLSQSVANFDYIEIFYTDNNTRQPNSVRVYSPNGKYVTLSCIEPSTSSAENRIYIRTSGWTISGTSMSVGRSDLDGDNRGVYGQFYPSAGGENTNVDLKITANNYIKIFRVVGYKK